MIALLYQRSSIGMLDRHPQQSDHGRGPSEAHDFHYSRAGRSARNPEAFARFLSALAAAMRRHRNIVSYEIDNEENVQQW